MLLTSNSKYKDSGYLIYCIPCYNNFLFVSRGRINHKVRRNSSATL